MYVQNISTTRFWLDSRLRKKVDCLKQNGQFAGNTISQWMKEAFRLFQIMLQEKLMQ